MSATDPIHEEEALGKALDARLLGRLLPYVRPYRWQVALTLLLVVPLFALEVAQPWVVKHGIELALGEGGGDDPFLWLLEPPSGLPALAWLAALFLTATVGHAALRYVHLLLMATTGQYAMRDLRRRVFDHLQSLHLGFFDRVPVGRLVTRATNDVENVAEMFSAGIVALVTDVIVMAGYAAVLFAVDPKLALATFAVVPVLAAAAVFFRLKVREAFRLVRVRIARINAHIQETIGGMKVVQLFSREARNLRDFDAMNAAHRDAWKMSIRYDALLFSAVEAAQNTTVAIIIWYGTGVAEAGVLFLFVDLMRRFFMPLRDLSAKYSVMQSSMASCERIFQLMDEEPAIRDPEQPRQVPRRRASGSVEFRDVWFAYRDEEWVLRGVSFRVEPGEKVAFVGATGAGKTTIIKLLTRIHDVDRGAVLVDGVDVRDMRQRDLRSRVATVLQDVVLFSGSVADNIALDRTDLGRADVERCARAVEADGFIRRLPHGYDTAVRERGSNLSAGQRQLLSFARGLAHGADILVLDEATSSIDTETEALVQKGLHSLMERQTSIAIAHRLSTVRDVDRIFVLDAGRLVEEGTHGELLAREGLYARLYRLQAQEEGSAVSPEGHRRRQRATA